MYGLLQFCHGLLSMSIVCLYILDLYVNTFHVYVDGCWVSPSSLLFMTLLPNGVVTGSYWGWINHFHFIKPLFWVVVGVGIGLDLVLHVVHDLVQ